MPQKILVVEDEPSIAETIAYALETEGFEVLWTTNASEALASLNTAAPALVILDVGLPDQNGFDVCRSIRKLSAVPIVFLTARDSEVDRVVGLELGGDDYIAKPFSPRELTARVRAILRRTAHEPIAHTAAQEVTAAFRVDKPRMRIYYFAKLLPLSRYEYRLLEVLIGRPGWVYTREKLMEMVWESPESSMDRTVDTHVKTIRAKLHQVRPDLDPIVTHRGVGYSLEVPE